VRAGQVTLVRRDTGARETVAADGAAGRLSGLLAEIQSGLLEAARDFRDTHRRRPAGREELLEFLSAGGGFATGPWCGDRACEADVRGHTTASIRYLELDGDMPTGRCVACGKPASETATWGRAY
jgi:prolyl-tRNA synthetase